jgi:hypothetical protein
MIKIEIESTEVQERTGSSSKTGKPYRIREQDAWGYFHDADGRLQRHPQKIRITLGDTENPYQPGVYHLAPESFYPDRFGQISVRARLKAVAASAPKAAA